MKTDPSGLRPGVDVSVVVNAHAEGLLAFRTLRSAKRSADHAARNAIRVEILGVLDSADNETRQVFLRYPDLVDSIIDCDFRDPGSSRNSGVQAASGKYVAFLAAGDLVSENWLTESHREAERSAGDRLILHPEIVASFGTMSLYRRHPDQRSPGFRCWDLVERNCWTSEPFCSRELLLSVPYSPSKSGSGFGFEEWHWNCETILRGAVHVPVPGTVHFVRGADEDRHRLTLRPTRLFNDLSLLRRRPGPVRSRREAVAARARDGLRQAVLYRARAVHYLRSAAAGLPPRRARLATRLAAALQRALPLGILIETLPAWLEAEMRSISLSIETDLFPDRQLRVEMAEDVIPDHGLGRYYCELFEKVGAARFSHVFVVPWVKRGGADLGLLHHVRAVAEGLGSGSLVITTLDTDSPWLGRLPRDVGVIELGKACKGLPAALQEALLSRILLQASPEVIHVINSELGWKVLGKFGRAHASMSRLFASVFADGFSGEGKPIGYARSHLFNAFPFLSGTFFDTESIPRFLQALYGYPSEKLRTLYFPSEPPVSLLPRDASSKTILWAGRLDYSKRLDILLGVALACPDLEFHVYGGNEPLFKPRWLAKLSSLSNVTLKGAYDGFFSIPTHLYAAYLYTSSSDGMPNALLEAAGARMPIIASSVGGIPEFIDGSSGILVSPADDVQAYVAAIRAIIQDPRKGEELAAAAFKRLASRHSWDSFLRGLQETPGYRSRGQAETGFEVGAPEVTELIHRPAGSGRSVAA